MSSSKISKIWTVTEILKVTKEFLESKGIDDARICAETFVMEALSIKQRHELYIMFDSVVSEEELSKVREMMKRRVVGEPLQYIVGKTKFYSFDFKVDHRALIPREETEFVVDMFEKYSKNEKNLSVLDMCTGSGIIGITVKKIFSDVKIVISDISKDALELAKENIFLNKIDEIEVVNCDGVTAFENEKFDFILSNPPYVIDEIVKTLDREVKDWEPHLALKAGKQGLDFFINTKNDVCRVLKKNGYYIFEYGGFEQTSKIIDLYSDKFVVIEIVKDFNNIDRVIVLQKTID